jgi:hypothetical protein
MSKKSTLFQQFTHLKQSNHSLLQPAFSIGLPISVLMIQITAFHWTKGDLYFTWFFALEVNFLEWY